MGELSEFLLARRATREEIQGRTSGDLNWRRSRGELGSAHRQPVVWVPSEQEISTGEFRLEYSAGLDHYVRRSNNDVVEKWSSGVFQAESVFRKCENDWKMAYLARTGTV